MKNNLSKILGLLSAGLLAAPLPLALAQQEPAMPQLGAYEEDAAEIEGEEEQWSTLEGELSVGELQQMLNLPPSARIRKEYQEDLENPPSLFELGDEEAILDLFGKKPPFVYFPVGVDPMIIPWVRARVIAEELFEEASVAIANKDFEKAEDILTEIREKYPETEVAPQVPQQLQRVRSLIAQSKEPGVTPTPTPTRDTGPSPGTEETILPPWVRENTTAVMIADKRTVMVGNDFLTIGEAVPRYPSIRVKEITTQEVIFDFQDKEFTVTVDGSF